MVIPQEKLMKVCLENFLVGEKQEYAKMLNSLMMGKLFDSEEIYAEDATIFKSK